MANLIQVRFLRDHNAFKEGQVESFDRAALSAYGDAIEVITPPAAETPVAGVEYDSEGLVAKLTETNRELREKLSESETALVRAHERIQELEQQVADYAKLEGAPVEPADIAAREPTPSATTDAPPPETPATPAATGDAGWRNKPTASLNIPANLKSLLLPAGFDTAGKVADGLQSGHVLAIDGVGEAKANTLQEFIDALAAS